MRTALRLLMRNTKVKVKTKAFLTITTTRPLSSCSSSSHLVNAILRSKTPRQALDSFDTALGRVDPENRPPLYAAVLHVLVRSRQFTRARCLMKCFVQDLLGFHHPKLASRLAFESLHRAGFNPDAFGVLITTLSQLGLVGEASWAIRKLENLPSLQTCNVVLGALVKARRFDSAFEVYSQIVARGFEPDVVTYGILINARSKLGCLSDALQLFDEMSERGIAGNVVVYATVIHALCSQNKMAEAEGLFRRMREEAGAGPSPHTYHSLMEGYFRSGDPKKALEYYREMPCEGLVPNAVTFGVLVEGFCRAGQARSARSVFAHMAKLGVPPNAIIYNSLIVAHACSGKSVGGELLSEMESLGISPDEFTLGAMIKSLCSTSRVGEADEILRRIDRANLVMYNSLIDGYCKQNDMARATEVRSRMMSRDGVAPNVVTFSTLIDGHCKAGDTEAALGLYRELLGRDIRPDVITFTALMDGLCKNGEMEEALRVLNEMIGAGISPNAHTFSSLVVGLCRVGKCYEALELFGSENKTRVPKNHVTYTALIAGLCRAGLVSEAAGLFSEMRRVGFRSDIVSYLVMLRGLSGVKHIVDLQVLHSDLIKSGFAGCTDLGRILARGYQDCGYLKSGSDLCEDHQEYPDFMYC